MVLNNFRLLQLLFEINKIYIDLSHNKYLNNNVILYYIDVKFFDYLTVIKD